MGKLHSLSIDQEEGNFLKGVKEDILRAAKVVGGACTGDEIDKTIDELRDQLMDYVGMAAREDGCEELKKWKESIQEQAKVREGYMYLDGEISRIMDRGVKNQERRLITFSYVRWSGRYA